MNFVKILKNFIYFLLEYIGIIEVVFEVKSSSILTGIFVNYIFGKKILKLHTGQLVDRERLEFSIQRFLEKTFDFPIYTASLILPSEMFVSKLVTIPKVPRSKLKNLVISNIESMGMFDISSLVYGYDVVGEYKTKGRTFIKVLISAIKLNIVSKYIDSFKSSGIFLKNVFPSTISNINILRQEFSENAVGIVINKQNEVLVSIVKGNDIIRLEILEAVEKSIIENYTINIISDFVKERTFFLEKILFLGFEYDFIERIFDRVNIICISLDFDKKYTYILENYQYIDIISIYYKKPKINLLPESYKKSILTDLIVFNISCFITLLTIVGFLIVIATQSETSKYLLFKKGIEGEQNVPEEVKKYIQIVELKNKLEKYEKFINSFYEEFKNSDKIFSVLYLVFSKIDRKTYLSKVEMFPKGITLKGYSKDNNSLYDTIKNLSTIDHVRSVKLSSINEQDNNGRKLIYFQIEVEL